MNTRFSAGPHVCLRCRRQQAKRNYSDGPKVVRYPVGPIPPRKPPRTPNPYDYKSKRLNVLAARELAHRRWQDAKPHVIRDGAVAGGGHDVQSGSHGRRKTHDLEDLHTPRLEEESAKILVLRDSKISTYIHDQIPFDVERRIDPEHIDILGQLLKERGLVGEDEVRQGIEGFRPAQGSTFATWDEMNSLVQKLNDGFTGLQLERYIEAFRESPGVAQDHSSSPSRKAPRTANFTPWYPGISDNRERFESHPLRGYLMQSHAQKQRSALHLIRECWGVEVQEVADGIGQFEISLLDTDLELMLAGSPSALDSLHAECLALDDEKLEVFRSRGVIRVTTTSSKRNWIIKNVEDILATCVTEQFSLRTLYPEAKSNLSFQRWVEEYFDTPTLQEVARLAKVQVAQHKYHTIDLSCVTRNQGGRDFRLPAARRLLMMAGNLSQRIDRRLASSHHGQRVYVSYPLINGLNWWARLRTWFRCVAPISKESSTTPSSASDTDGEAGIDTKIGRAYNNSDANDSIPVVETRPQNPATSESGTSHSVDIDPASSASLITTTSQDSKLSTQDTWPTSCVTHTTATMGAVLHSSPSLGLAGVSPAEYTPKDGIHTFSTHVPNLSRFTRSATAMNPDSALHHLVLEFKPDPSQLVTRKGVKIGSSIFEAMPTMELQFRRTPGSPFKLHDIQAVVEETYTDVMLPQKAVDVRFSQRVTSRVRKMLPSVAEYVKRCSLDVSNLEIWPHITLPISQHLCRAPGLELFEPSNHIRDSIKPSKHSAPSTTTRDVQYIFSGLEFRKNLLMKYKGWDVSYTDINAGKSGGKRGELSLRPILNGNAVSEEDFATMAYEVADVLGGAFDTPDEPVVVRSVKSGASSPAQIRKVSSTSNDSTSNGPTYSYFPRRINLDLPEDVQDMKNDSTDLEEMEEPIDLEELDEEERLNYFGKVPVTTSKQGME